MNALEEARAIRRRKNVASDCLHEALEHVRKLRWAVFPDGTPVYLDLNEVQNMDEIHEHLTNLMERHNEDLKELAKAGTP